MANVHPFSALRYDPERVGDISNVIAPPYDVINTAEQDRLYATSPYNIVRLTLGKQYDTDDDGNNRYTRARTDFDTWITDGILQRDTEPGFYITEHRFTYAGNDYSRIGFTGLLGFEHPEGKGVYRHEKTLSAPKKDRTLLLASVPANLSPVFCVYPDADASLQGLLVGHTSTHPPAFEASLHDQRLRMWVLTDPASIQSIREGLAKTAVLIADGHHRFEVARGNKDRFPAVMTHFVSMQDPSLVIWPIHRVVNPKSGNPLTELQGSCDFEQSENLEATLGWLNAEQGKGRFGAYWSGAYYRAAVRPDAFESWKHSADIDPQLADLDVSILQEWLLPAIGVERETIVYQASPDEALARAAERPGSMVWFLRGIPLEQVYALARQDLVLSPKSTYFYPKVLAGLTLNPLKGLVPA